MKIVLTANQPIQVAGLRTDHPDPLHYESIIYVMINIATATYTILQPTHTARATTRTRREGR